MKKIIEVSLLALLLTGLFAAANYPVHPAASSSVMVGQIGPVPVCPPWKSGCTDPGYPYPQKFTADDKGLTAAENAGIAVAQLGPVPVCPPWKSGCTDPGYPYPQK